MKQKVREFDCFENDIKKFYGPIVTLMAWL